MMRMLGEGDQARQQHLFEEAAKAARASGNVEPIACVDFCVGEFELGRGRTSDARMRTEAALHACMREYEEGRLTAKCGLLRGRFGR